MLAYRIKENLKQLRNSSNSDYEFVRWLLCIFVAGALYSIILYQFGTQLLSTIPHVNFPTKDTPDAVIDTVALTKMIVYGLFLFAIPPLLSIISTRLIPEKRIVPSLFIHMIALGYMSFYFSTYHTTPVLLLVNVFVLFMYSVFIGLVHDSIVRTVLGRNVRDEDLITYSYKTKTNVKDLENFFLASRQRDHFKLDGKVEEIENGIRLKNRTEFSKRLVIEIKYIDKNNEKEGSFLNLAFFEKGHYYFKHTDKLIDHSDMIASNIKQKVESNLGQLETVSDKNAIMLKEDILLQAGGLYSQVDQISRTGWTKIISFVIVIGISIGLIVTNYVTEGITTMAVVLLYIIFDLPRKLLSRHH